MNIQKRLIDVNYSTAKNQRLGIVIHTMVGTLDGTDGWFRNPDAKVSAHYGVDLASDKVYQWVEEHHTAWAQGVVSNPTNELVKQKGGNPNSYMISIECADGRNPGTADRTIQHPNLVDLVKDITKRNNISLDRVYICGHREIYDKKTCPGNINVDRVVQNAAGEPMVTLPQREVDEMRQRRDEVYVWFRTLCEIMGIATDFDVAQGELKKLVETEDKLAEKNRQLEDANKRIGDLQTDVKTLTQDHAEAIEKNEKLKTEVEKQKDEIEKQSFSITTITEQLEELKKQCNAPLLAGWRKLIYNLLIKI